MTSFINISNHKIINVNEIKSVQRVLFNMDKYDSIAEELGHQSREPEFRRPTLAKIQFVDGEVLDVPTFIYSDQDAVEQIDRSWDELIKHLGSELVNL